MLMPTGPDALVVQPVQPGVVPAQQDLCVRRGSAGDYAAIIVEVDQADGVTPVPLAGATATLVVESPSGAILLTKSTADGSMALDPTSSRVTWLPTSADTMAIPEGRIATYELTLLFPNGSSGPYLTGYLIGLDGDDDYPGDALPAGAGASSSVVRILVPGTPGPPGGSSITKTAANTLSGHKVVKAVAGGVDLASSSDPASFGAVIGITTAAAAQGAPATVQTSDEITEPTWSWAIGSPVFLGLGGGLTQTPVATGFLQQLGVATAPTTIFVDVQPPILRA